MPHLDERDRIVAVCNTGPLVSAFQSDSVHLLRSYFARIYVAPTQPAEFARHGAWVDFQALLEDQFALVAPELNEDERTRAASIAEEIAAQPTSGNPDPGGHLPEAELLVIATRPELACKIVLLDEMAARTVAGELGLRVTGYPGILARAGLDGLLTRNQISSLLLECQRQGTHYSNALIEHVATTYGR